MTTQEYYDLLFVSALDGTFPCTDINYSPLYKGSNGKGCAIGILISEELYSYRFENRAIMDVIDVCPKIKNIFPLSVTFMQQIQQIHDDLCYCSEEQFRKSFLVSLNYFRAFQDCNKLKGRPYE